MLAELAQIPATLVLYESPKRVHRLLGELGDHFGTERQAVVCRELTKRFEEVARGSLAELEQAFADRAVKGEIVVLVDRAPAPVADSQSLEAALRAALPGKSVKDAAAEVAAALNRAGIGLATFRPTPLRAYAAPLKVLEYMASGLPVLSTKGTEAGDLVDRTGTGAATSCDPQAIARAAIGLLNNATAYAEMSGAGTAAARLHDWSLVMSWEWQMITEPDLASLQMRRAAVPEGMHP